MCGATSACVASTRAAMASASATSCGSNRKVKYEESALRFLLWTKPRSSYSGRDTISASQARSSMVVVNKLSSYSRTRLMSLATRSLRLSRSRTSAPEVTRMARVDAITNALSSAASVRAATGSRAISSKNSASVLPQSSQ
eukprot:Amastigsp_a188018_7.p3 type:complete len:141 gc:universal Amastigsp_a188018_7:884-462(-)